MTEFFTCIRNSKEALSAVLLFFCFGLSYGQNGEPIDFGTLNGNFQVNSQYYGVDTLIGAPEFPEKVGTNAFMYLQYTRGNFSAGMRYEAYLPALQGFTRAQGQGISNRFLRYSSDMIDVTVGNFYEQFGSGLALRTYEEWGLGFDNSLDGARVKFRPYKGIELTALIGKQRDAISPNINTHGAGIVRGFNADFSINDFIPGMDTIGTRITFGGSFVSKFEKDDDPVLIIPENVATFAGRAGLTSGGFSLSAEYVYKINDPSSVNNQIFKPGNGFLLQTSYSQKGLGISLALKRIDNLDFRSERSATFNNLTLNYLPPQTKQHTYRLPTLFPWASQPLGEVAAQLEVLYKIPRGSKIGGKYGTNITFNFSRIHGLKKTDATDPDMGYASEVFGVGDLYFQDINIEVSRKFNKKLKGVFSYLYFNYERALFHQLTGFEASEDVKSHVAIVELQYKITGKHSIRTEIQHAYTQQEFGSWAMLLVEYNFAPHWFIAAFDEWNYGNADTDKRLHYFTVNGGYTFRDYRLSVGYGRQRAGVLCVGGVCRVVPASNGVTLSITGSF